MCTGCVERLAIKHRHALECKCNYGLSRLVTSSTFNLDGKNGGVGEVREYDMLEL